MLLNCLVSNSDNFRGKQNCPILEMIQGVARYFLLQLNLSPSLWWAGFMLIWRKQRSMCCVDCIISFYTWIPMSCFNIELHTFTDMSQSWKVLQINLFSFFVQRWSTLQKKSLKFMNNFSFIWCRYVSCNIYLLN